MAIPQSIRALLPLLIGLVVGGAGATMFLESMPGSEGSPEERANKLELELKRAQKQIASLEAAGAAAPAPRSLIERLAGGSSGGREESTRTLSDGARRIAEDIRAGRPVSPDDIFRATQPLMRDLAPLFDRMRVKGQQQQIDSMTGELARKYALTPQSQELLKKWFEKKANEEAKRWSELVARDGTRLEDVMRASQNIRPDEGLDAFMPGILGADKLAAFRAERMGERVQRVEREADMKVQRLDAIVGLDEAQRDQVFGIVARGSREYDPAMVLEGARSEIGPTPSGNPEATMLSVLRPEQRATYEAEQQRRRESAAKDMEAIGLTLPPDWEMLGDGFR